MSAEIEANEILYKGWTTFSLATVRLPDGTRVKRVLEDHGDAAAVLPYDPARRCALLVRQFRTPAFVKSGQHSTLEAIAGGIEDHAAEDCARREAMEEAGVRLTGLQHVGTAWSSPGFSTERLHLYLAEYSGSDRIGEGGGAEGEHENIEVAEINLALLARMHAAGEIEDLKTLTLLQALMLKRPDLF